MRGADYSIPHQLSLIYDSSPHARGRLDRYETNTTRQRFIPSCEGQTRPTGRLGFFRLIHPLMRGADGLRTSSRSLTSDSSPHAKGRLTNAGTCNSSSRFIPSCEGQTVLCDNASFIFSIHPLMRRADPQCLCGFQPP